MKSRAVLAGTVAGLAHALALVHGSGWSLGWVALIPLFAAIQGQPWSTRVLAASAYTFTVVEVDMLPWLAPAVTAYFRVSVPAAITASILVPGVQAIFHGALLGAAIGWGPRLHTAWGACWWAGTWTAWESLRTILPPAYPEAMLGLTQQHAPAVLQIASVLGLAGVTALVAFGNAGFTLTMDRSLPPRRRASMLGLTVVAIAAAVAFGRIRLRAPLPPDPTAPRIVGVDIGARDASASTLARYIAATPRTLTQGARLVVWPESALPFDVTRDALTWSNLATFVRDSETDLATGGLRTTTGSDGVIVQWNALHVLRPGHGLVSYDKRRPAPFAEAWPRWLGSPPAGITSIALGEHLRVFHGERWSWGPLICSEITDGAGARRLVAEGARAIVNVTNDAVFAGHRVPLVPWARVRAIESGRPVIRVANAGPSMIIDSRGRVAAASVDTAAGVRILDGHVPAVVDTIYSETGEMFVAGCILLFVIGIFGARRRDLTARR